MSRSIFPIAEFRASILEPCSAWTADMLAMAVLISGIADTLLEQSALDETSRFNVSEMSRNSVLNELRSFSISRPDDVESL